MKSLKEDMGEKQESLMLEKSLLNDHKIDMFHQNRSLSITPNINSQQLINKDIYIDNN